MGQKSAARSADPPYISRAHAAPMRVLLLLLPLGALALAEEAPTGLLCDFQRAPALGVRNSPRFTWIVPPCTSSPDLTQSAYRIVVFTANNGTVVWESGKVASADSTYHLCCLRRPGSRLGLAIHVDRHNLDAILPKRGFCRGVVCYGAMGWFQTRRAVHIHK